MNILGNLGVFFVNALNAALGKNEYKYDPQFTVTNNTLPGANPACDGAVCIVHSTSPSIYNPWAIYEYTPSVQISLPRRAKDQLVKQLFQCSEAIQATVATSVCHGFECMAFVPLLPLKNVK